MPDRPDASPRLPGVAPELQLRDHVAVARATEALLPELRTVGEFLIEAFRHGHRVYALGNGGSAAEAQHLAAELIGRYRRDRRPLPAVALSTDPSSLTCIANDYGYAHVFGRQVEALAGPGDVVIAFSTSGRSPNVVEAMHATRRSGATSVLFTGRAGGVANDSADHVLRVPSDVTARIQEMHLLLLHLLSEQVDVWAAGEVEAAHESDVRLSVRAEPGRRRRTVASEAR